MRTPAKNVQVLVFHNVLFDLGKETNLFVQVEDPGVGGDVAAALSVRAANQRPLLPPALGKNPSRIALRQDLLYKFKSFNSTCFTTYVFHLHTTFIQLLLSIYKSNLKVPILTQKKL